VKVVEEKDGRGEREGEEGREDATHKLEEVGFAKKRVHSQGAPVVVHHPSGSDSPVLIECCEDVVPTLRRLHEVETDAD